jgi:hypothetical protein
MATVQKISKMSDKRTCSICGSSETSLKRNPSGSFTERWYESEYGPVCERCHSRQYRLNNPEILKSWKDRNKDYILSYQRKWREAHPNYAKNWLAIK